LTQSIKDEITSHLTDTSVRHALGIISVGVLLSDTSQE
jgi:hypothetical protein